METLCGCIHMKTWRHSMSISTCETHERHSMSISTWRHKDTPCPYSTWRHGDIPCQYPHGDMETWETLETYPYPYGYIQILHVHINMDTFRHSISISTWIHSDTPCPYSHGDMETHCVDIHMSHHVST